MAAFDFPNSPSNGDTYTANGVTFTWNGTIWQRTSASTGAQGGTGAQGSQGATGVAGLSISTSAPGSPSAGDLWWDSDSGLFLTYYNDGNSSQWVELNQGPKGAQGATGPTGAQGATGPTGAQGAAGAQGATGAAGSNASISSNADNRVITGGSGTNLVGEANLTFNGSTLAVTGAITASTSITATNNLITNGNFTISTTNPNIFLTDTDNDSDYRISNSNGVLEFRDVTNSAQRMSITSDGYIQFGVQSSDTPITNAHIKHIDGGQDYWNSTKGDYRSLRYLAFFGGIDNAYGMGISSSELELQSQQDIGFYAGTSGSNTGRRNLRILLDNSENSLDFQSNTKLCLKGTASDPQRHARINIGRDSAGETRAIDIWGSWSSNENKSITFNHGANTSNIVGQINCIHYGPGSSMRWGKLYHSGDSSTYTLTLDSTSTTGADLNIVNGNLKVASGHGIDFSATGDSAGNQGSSELLDDYEEGTWTPAFKAGNNSTSSPTTVNEAKYTRIGRMVHAVAYFTMSSYASGTTGGDTRIVGLPYINIGDHGAANIHYWNSLKASVNYMTGTVQGSSYEILIRGTNSSSTSTTNLDFDNHFGPSDSLIVSATYFTT